MHGSGAHPSGFHAAAAPCYLPQMQLQNARALVDTGHRHRAAGELEAAEVAFREAERLAPGEPNPPHNLGVVLQLRGDFEGAEAAFRRSLAIDPGRAITRNALGLALLGQGRLAEGFRLQDAWRELPERASAQAPALPFPRWTGEDLAGKRVLVVSEEGYGDQIMFARFARALRDRGAQVGWLCPPALVRLFSESLGIPAAPAVGEVRLGEFEFYCPSSALPIGFDLSLATLPPAPYLDLPPPVRRPGCRIGIAWRGNPANPNDANRSLPPEVARRLLDLPGAVSLHPEETGAKDFYETAQVMAGLDLVISVESAPAHQAGALGVPTWVLLTAIGADWRWLSGRADSPWYGSVTLHRQDRPGDWQGVIERLPLQALGL